jgi:2-C-methyl-D-erythritol 2,4-cyclodiphosphate synthase
VDATVIADAPKLIGYKARMRRAISQLLEIRATQVSVKAKTTGGFTPGKGGIAAHAVVLLQPSLSASRVAAQARRKRRRRKTRS